MHKVDILCQAPLISLLTLDKKSQWFERYRILYDLFESSRKLAYFIIDLTAIPVESEQSIIDAVKQFQMKYRGAVVVFVTTLKDYPRYIVSWRRLKIMPSVADALAMIHHWIAEKTYVTVENIHSHK